MPHYTTEAICNLALVGQTGAGKTTLVEKILQQAQVINNAGNIAAGNTVCDFDPLEKTYQHSLNASIVSFDYHDRHINLIDTPGTPDLIGHAFGVFPAVETVAVVINAATGVEMLTRRFLKRTAEQKLCRLIIVNRIDAENVHLEELVAQLRDTFGAECLPINLPANQANQVVDCFFNPAGESDFSSVAQAHTAIIDQVVEVDEELMALYLEQGQELTPEQLHAPFEKALREGHLIPVCFVSAKTGAGIPELLDLLVKLMPNPLEGNPRPFLRGEGASAEPFAVVSDPDKHVVAHVFKVSADPYMGKIGLFRIHQGTITKDSQLFIGDARKPFKVNHLFKLQGKQQIEMARGIPGDICAVAKVDNLFFDAVLHDSHEEDYLHLMPQTLPRPMYGLAVTPKRQGDEQKVSQTLQRLVEEDPCLRLEHHVALNETVLFGMGDLHLRLLLERMQQQYNIEVNTSIPKIPYRETISQAAEGHHRHKKQTGGAGQFGEVFLRIEPLERGQGFEFVDAITGGAIPGQFVPAVEKGVQQVMDSGAIAGYAMQDIRVTVYDGKYHPVDSKEIAFVSAGKKAFLAAILQAKPLILEPIVTLEVNVPQSAMGSITGDLATKRGRILGSEMQGEDTMIVRAEVPLSELSHYSTELKSVTGGHGHYSMELSHYEPVPHNVQQQLMSAYKPVDHEE
ncbi:elongation factor G [Thioflexithrix psekupsensis]|uniref:Elongation factor G n=1 Tax=Thioflexithrix psekupsensis TaxID=1570016 RepID=A0A251X6N0_9GAMM|nr:elongation factor G [Thioflexithrix psekupsensis]OUD13044.1 elongation factor G [Thioflexithrix psekupsensis]